MTAVVESPERGEEGLETHHRRVDLLLFTQPPSTTDDRRNQVAWIFKPAVGIIEDATLLVSFDPVAVNELTERGSPIDLTAPLHKLHDCITS